MRRSRSRVRFARVAVQNRQRLSESKEGDGMTDWLAVALQRDVVSRSFRIALVVGTLLVAINQGNYVLAGGLPADAAWKVPLTYLVPYVVSTYASVGAIRTNRRDSADPDR